MQRILKTRRLLTAAVAGALAFGAAQAVAAPAVEASDRACRPDQCNQRCIRQGFDGGACSDVRCFCFIVTPTS